MSLNKKLLWGGLGWVFGDPIGAILGYTYASMSNKNPKEISGASNPQSMVILLFLYWYFLQR